MTHEDLFSIARHAHALVVGVSPEAFADLFDSDQRDPGVLLLDPRTPVTLADAYDRYTEALRVYRDSRALREQVIILETRYVRAPS